MRWAQKGSVDEMRFEERIAVTQDSSRLGEQVLSPIAFLERAESMYGDRVAYSFEGRTQTYAEFGALARRIAGLLVANGIRPGDRVAVLAANTPLLLLAHFAVPMSGGVLVALNHRLAQPELAFIVQHSGADLLLHDAEFSGTAETFGIPVMTADEVLATGSTEHRHLPEDERSLLSINYTSGTTGRPKGVMYHHRGAYLQALAMVHHADLGLGSVYLWTLPMFHCNGWCFPWAMVAAAGEQVCLTRPDTGVVWTHLREGRVTNFHAAPTVLSGVSRHQEARNGPLARTVRVGTGGAPPSPTLLCELGRLGIEVTHLYGLTETFGPAVINELRPEWSALDLASRSTVMSRQGNSTVIGTGLRVVDNLGISAAGDDVAADGEAMGEILVRGNNVMLGYYNDEQATAAASLAGGWFRTGDLAVMHPDRSVEIRDRSKDVIISGGENIASVEVEHVLTAHPAVSEVAVIGVPHERWGEVPIAVVMLRDGEHASAQELIAYTRDHIAGFKAPTEIYFQDLPKSGTGKVLKHRLRDRFVRPSED